MRIFTILVVFAIVIIFGLVWLVSTCDAKGFTKSEADKAWKAMQKDVKEKVGAEEAKDSEKANKLKSKDYPHVLYGRYRSTFKVELYDKDWSLRKIRYEREQWRAEEQIGKKVKIGNKVIYVFRRVKIWSE